MFSLLLACFPLLYLIHLFYLVIYFCLDLFILFLGVLLYCLFPFVAKKLGFGFEMFVWKHLQVCQSASS